MSTIVDVAERAGVSMMTVSRFFNDPAKLAPATYERVRRAVDELHYVPNAAARSLIRGRSDTVALVLADIRNPFFMAVARGVEEVAQNEGYTLLLGNSNETLKREKEYLQALVGRRVDGVIVAPSQGPRHNFSVLRRRKIPTVMIDRRLPQSQFDVVRGDTRTGGKLLTEHLIDEGYRRIAFIGGYAGASSLVDRLGGYQEAMAAAGLEERSVLGRYDQGSGYEIVQGLVAQARSGKGNLPEALIAANSMVGLGALLGLRELGMAVPGDVALAAFDDLEIASQIDPFFTVVRQPAYEIGKEAMRLLLERLKDSERPPEERVLPVELVKRRSTLRSAREESVPVAKDQG
jgi:LacI family transcriptional regulator